MRPAAYEVDEMRKILSHYPGQWGANWACQRHERIRVSGGRGHAWTSSSFISPPRCGAAGAHPLISPRVLVEFPLGLLISWYRWGSNWHFRLTGERLHSELMRWRCRNHTSLSIANSLSHLYEQTEVTAHSQWSSPVIALEKGEG